VFAHAEEPVRFTSEPVLVEARKLHGWQDGASARELFDAAADRSETAINAKMHGLIYANAAAE